jgi:thiol-disulfide isomerase/thioredoxin
MKQYALNAGQTEKVVFQYTPYDENSFKGDYNVDVNIRLHNGEPAASVPYTVYYEDKHFGSIIIEEANVPDDGRIKLTGLAGGDNAPYFTIEIEKGKLGRYLFQLLGENKKRELEYQIAPFKDNTAPDITVMDIFTGQEVMLSDYRGKVIFAEFWATWCGPCQDPTAKLCEIASKRKNDWADNAVLLCISIDKKKEDVINHVRNRGWLATRHLWCHKGEPGWKSDAARKYGITGVPTALLIDQSGNIVWRGHPESFDIEANIDELLRNN